MTKLEIQKAEEAKALKIKIDALQSDICVEARLIRQRYEMRDVECVAKFHHPRNGLKTIVRMDTDEEIRTETMTPEECQQRLVLVGESNE